jgi:hypothetical protein
MSDGRRPGNVDCTGRLAFGFAARPGNGPRGGGAALGRCAQRFHNVCRSRRNIFRRCTRRVLLSRPTRNVRRSNGRVETRIARLLNIVVNG